MRLAIAMSVAAFLVLPARADDARQAIEAANRQFEQVFARGDAAGLASLYTEDAFLLPPGAPLQTGRAAIERFWAEAVKQLDSLSLTVVDVQTTADGHAREVGTVKARTKGAQPQELTGKYSVFWKRVGSDWRMNTDIWNLDK